LKLIALLQKGDKPINTTNQTATMKRDKQMNTKQQTAIKESNMKITGSTLIHWAGLAAIVAGLLFVFVQLIHPPELLSSVTTSTWVIVHYMTIAMCLLGLFGIAGLYVRQVKEVGWLGLVGYLLFSLFLALTMALVVAEAFILPLLTTETPKFVEGFLGIVSGSASEINLGTLPTLGLLAGLFYMFGGVLFGVATFRAGILPRWAGVVLAVGTVLPPLLPHDIVRLAAVPVGLALAWLGYALWSERRENAADPLLDMGSAQLRQAGVE
jgi:hypothetical protein